MIVVPLIFINSLSSAIGAVSLMEMPKNANLALAVATTLLNLMAAVLVAVQVCRRSKMAFERYT